MNDELEQRLRSADPAPAPRQGQPAAPWIRDLVEATMTTTTERPPQRSRQRSRWLAVAACGAAAVLSATAYVSMQDPDTQQARRPPVPAVQLALTGTDASASCPMFSVEMLKGMPTAFGATVTSVEGGTVRLKVDRWYRGGASDEVVLKAPADQDVALVGAVRFEQGLRYLVTATEGVVNSCGFTGPWDAQMEAAFEQAFTG